MRSENRARWKMHQTFVTTWLWYKADLPFQSSEHNSSLQRYLVNHWDLFQHDRCRLVLASAQNHPVGVFIIFSTSDSIWLFHYWSDYPINRSSLTIWVPPILSKNSHYTKRLCNEKVGAKIFRPFEKTDSLVWNSYRQWCLVSWGYWSVTDI